MFNFDSRRNVQTNQKSARTSLDSNQILNLRSSYKRGLTRRGNRENTVGHHSITSKEALSGSTVDRKVSTVIKHQL